MNSRTSEDPQQQDAGAPMPDFRANNIQLLTVAPALGVTGGAGSAYNKPDYLEYDASGRGIMVTMFANTGLSYMLGIAGGGVYGLRQGLATTPSNRFRVQLNSVLNHCGRHGSRAGNAMGVFAVLYSLFEGVADYYALDDALGIRQYSPAAASMVNPAFGATATAAAYFATSGPRVAALAGTLGFGAVAATYTAYTVLGLPYGSRGYLFF